MTSSDIEFLKALRDGTDPTMGDIEHLLKMVRDGDVKHVDEIEPRERGGRLAAMTNGAAA